MIKRHILLAVLLMMSVLVFSGCSVNEENDEAQISVYSIWNETVCNTCVNSFKNDVVYLSENKIYLNSSEIIDFRKKGYIITVALDSQYVYFVTMDDTDSDITLVGYNRISGETNEILSSTDIALFQFQEEVLVSYDKPSKVAKINAGKLEEFRETSNLLDDNSSGTYAEEFDKDNYKFFFYRSNYGNTIRLTYVENDGERKMLSDNGENIVFSNNGKFTTNQSTSNAVKTINIPELHCSDQSLMIWDDENLYIISRYGSGPYTYEFPYDRKKEECLSCYNFDSGVIDNLISITPSEGQILGISLKQKKLFFLKNDTIYESLFDGSNQIKITNVGDIKGLHMEVCNDKMYLFETDGYGSYKLIKVEGI